MLSFLSAYTLQFRFTHEDVIGNQTPFFFDASAKDYFLTLMTGARLEVLPSELFSFPVRLIAYMNARKVSYICWVPTALCIVVQLNTCQELLPTSLKRVFFVGEVFPRKHLDKWRAALPQIEYVNLYGSSELAGICCFYRVPQVMPEEPALPLGKPLSNCNLLLLDGEGNVITQPGQVGEIHVASDALALGYYHDTEKTRNAFFPLTFPDGVTRRTFRTGDMASYNANGDLVFAARRDYQIKHMGRRIALGEIETVADTLPVLRRCCCLYHAEKKQIVLFCELTDGVVCTGREIRSNLKNRFKKALFTTLTLLLSVILLFAIYTAPYFYGTTYPYQDSKARDALAGQLDLLISGSSHAFRAFIPEQIDRAFGTNSHNLAYSMQTMQGRYFLLKKEMERNPVKTVLIEVSYNSLTRNRKSEGPEGDIYVLGRLAAPIERWSFFFSSISPSEYGKLYYDTIDRSTTAWKAILRGETGSAQDSVRGYRGMAPVDQTPSPEKHAEAYHSRSIVTEQDAYDIFYFEKCLELCREKNVRVILVTTPMPKKTLLSFDRMETVRLWYEEYAARFCCEFYDFNLLKSKAADYPESTAYVDETHLSSIGAQTFSEDLCEVLKKTENGASVEGLFYGSYDEMVEMLLRK